MSISVFLSLCLHDPINAKYQIFLLFPGWWLFLYNRHLQNHHLCFFAWGCCLIFKVTLPHKLQYILHSAMVHSLEITNIRNNGMVAYGGAGRICLHSFFSKQKKHSRKKYTLHAFALDEPTDCSISWIISLICGGKTAACKLKSWKRAMETKWLRQNKNIKTMWSLSYKTQFLSISFSIFDSEALFPWLCILSKYSYSILVPQSA